MRFFLPAIALLLFVHKPVEAQESRVAKQRIISSVTNRIDQTTYLDTIEIAKVEIYPDIGTYFRQTKDRTEQNNPYDAYLDKESIQRGNKFLRNHKRLLTSVTDSLSPSAEVLVAMLHIESNFGDYTETHQVLGALISILYFTDISSDNYNPADELLVLPSVAEKTGSSVYDLRGSFAGAFGIPQFLPTSFTQYAVDGNDDGDVNLFTLPDAVWSMAHYLHQHGWVDDPRGAVRAYYGKNSELYVDFVMTYASKLQNSNT